MTNKHKLTIFFTAVVSIVIIQLSVLVMILKPQTPDINNDQLTMLIVENNIAKLALDAAYTGIWSWNIQKDQLYWDESMFDIYDISEDKWISRYQHGWSDFVHPDDIVNTQKHVDEVLNDPSKRYFTSFRVMHKGEWRKILALGNVIRNAKGIPIRMTGVNILVPKSTDN